jgi:RNA recognition motif-containing protein
LSKFNTSPTPGPNSLLSLFVGGLSVEEDEGKSTLNSPGSDLLESLLKYFSAFGNVETINIIRGKKTSLSKGFGFITCGDKKTFNRIIEFRQHIIGERIVDVNYACGGDFVPLAVINMKRRKVYIKDLPLEVNKGKPVFPRPSQD